MNKVQYKMESILGDMYLVASSKGLHGLFWKKQNVPMVKDLTGHGLEIKILKSAVTEINEYLEGKRFEFEIPIELEGTEFQKKVWAELRKIPYGETRSYKDIAKLLKDEKASRAVGTANGKNPISLIVPCHRVITSSGDLGGYAGGLKAKNILLELEKKKEA